VQIVAGSIVIPAGVRGSGRLEIYAGRGYFYTRRNLSLQQTIAALQKVPRGNDVTLEVRMRGAHQIRISIPTDYALRGEPDPVALHLLH
jgi:hypothetical protein